MTFLALIFSFPYFFHFLALVWILPSHDASHKWKRKTQVAAGADHHYHDDDDKPLCVKFGLH